MWFNTEHGLYHLSPCDIAVLGEAGISFNEIINCPSKYPGLPPIWSRIPYLMLLNDLQTSTKLFWKSYRHLDTLIKNADRHYSPAFIPKSNGNTRALMVPDDELRRHQWYIHRNILCRIPVSEYAFAYCKHRGLTDLAQPHIGQETLIHLDIQDFFSAITEQMVFDALLRETGYPKSVAGDLSRLCCYRHHLPQGACTSPALSNICFKPCDEEIAALAQQYQLAYTRYSDDLYFSGNAVDAPAVIRQVKAILARHGFRVRSDKTRILGKHQAQKVTAIVVNKKMQVSREYRRTLRQELYYLKRFKEHSEGARNAPSYQTYLYQLLGKVTFVLYVDPGNREFIEARNMLNRALFW